MTLTGRIEPTVRRRDVRVALIVDSLLREPFWYAEPTAAAMRTS